ncbi:MAG: lycopene cyclase [Deltaproteobacteria bacterium]|nr:lycopene cyclase [Deltaproteobacteria bacterium]
MSVASSLERSRARARVREAGGDELLERLDHLDAVRAGRAPRGASRFPLSMDPHAPPAPPAVQHDDRFDYDVIVAGGGLWSVVAPLLAARGFKVAVLERTKVGAAHREWNASRAELQTLVDTGIVESEEALESLVVARYDRGTCRFHGGGDYPVTGVLDRAVDAAELLQYARRASERRGVDLLDGHSVLSHAANTHGVRVRVAQGSASRELTARVLVDARGASSPYASADLVCPTVGGVVRGLTEGTGPREMDPRVGEILATIDGVDENGRQHVWEAFPGRPGETTVYLFYYGYSREPHDLASLYARFFDWLPAYKGGEAELLRPTFGFIPGWSRLVRGPETGSRRVLLVGDAAARHSPLTYCGFGAALRSFQRCADSVVDVLEGVPAPRLPVDDAPVHRLTGALAHLIASRVLRGQKLNALLDAAFATLHAQGNDAYASLLKDSMSAHDFTRFLRGTAARHPAVWSEALRGMGPLTMGRWGWGLVRSWAASAQA